jgi:hypothetical protein
MKGAANMDTAMTKHPMQQSKQSKQPGQHSNVDAGSINALPWRPRLDARSYLYLCGGSVSSRSPLPGS